MGLPQSFRAGLVNERGLRASTRFVREKVFSVEELPVQLASGDAPVHLDARREVIVLEKWKYIERRDTGRASDTNLI